MHRHPWSKRGDFFWKLITRLTPQALRPLREAAAHGLIQPLDLFRLEFLRQGERRKMCFEEDLIGVCISDAAEQSRIGERAFQGVA